jgi:Fe-S cluster biogenesis protein NfuA/nitrite reductase/ring-hydroxylating ferredoxin subunit
MTSTIPEATDADLRQEAQRIELLLDEVRAMAGRPTWQRVEELVQRIVELHGAGIERILALVADAGGLDERFLAALCDDELVSSLLVLHGLHPVPTADRVRRALDGVRPYLGSHAGDVELVSVDAEGVVRLRLLGTCRGCPSSRATLEHTIEAAIEAAAPEVARIEVDASPATPEAAEARLVQIDLQRSRARAPVGQWRPVGGIDGLRPGALSAIEIDGVRVVVLEVAGAMLAYRNQCASCRSPLDGASLADDTLTCSACGRRYDVTRAGRPVGAEGDSLVPVPLLVGSGGARLLVREADR